MSDNVGNFSSSGPTPALTATNTSTNTSTADPGPGILGQSSSDAYGVVGINTGGTGVSGQNRSTTARDPGVEGIGVVGAGVQGHSQQGVGVVGFGPQFGVTGDGGESGVGVSGTSRSSNGVAGSSAATTGSGVFGNNTGGGPGVNGQSTTGNGVQGDALTATGNGVFGFNNAGGTGVAGNSNSGVGVMGESTSNWGVGGKSDTQVGVFGQSTSNWGVGGKSDTGVGVVGQSNSNWGVEGTSTSNDGVHGTSTTGTGVAGVSTSAIGVFGHGTPAGFFQGDVTVTGTVTVQQDIVLSNADCAEEFDVEDPVGTDSGTVMVIGDDEALHPSSEPYDRRVAGVVSGGGEYRPALLLDRRASSRPRSPVALVGKVCCKVDAQHEPVNVGDLLTTSPTPGHAMRASEKDRAFGAVIGKALQPLTGGRGLIAILVALQ